MGLEYAQILENTRERTNALREKQEAARTKFNDEDGQLGIYEYWLVNLSSIELEEC